MLSHKLNFATEELWLRLLPDQCVVLRYALPVLRHIHMHREAETEVDIVKRESERKRTLRTPPQPTSG